LDDILDIVEFERKDPEIYNEDISESDEDY
jgi:hypothetical protein